MTFLHPENNGYLVTLHNDSIIIIGGRWETLMTNFGYIKKNRSGVIVEICRIIFASNVGVMPWREDMARTREMRYRSHGDWVRSDRSVIEEMSSI